LTNDHVTPIFTIVLCVFAAHVYGLCVTEGPITDSTAVLQPFCQLLEIILRKGMKCR